MIIKKQIGKINKNGSDSSISSYGSSKSVFSSEHAKNDEPPIMPLSHKESPGKQHPAGLYQF
jgi:hypothetical protein